MNRFRHFVSIAAFLLLIVFITTSCKEKKQEKMPPPEITVVDVIQKDVPIYESFVGQVYGQRDIPIRARVSGFLEGIHFREGSMVKKGELLYTIDPQPFQAKVAVAKSQLAEAQTSMVKAKNDLDRIEPLAEINAVSKSDLDAAKAEYEAAKAFVEASKSNLRLSKIELGYCRILSPINGVIGKTQAKVGEFVGQNPNPVILNTVSLLDSVLVDFYLTEADFIGLAREFITNHQTIKTRNADTIQSKVSLILADGSTFKYKGRVNFVDRSIDPSTGTLLVQTVFPNPDGLLKPGLYGKVEVKMDVEKNAIVIPQRCIMEMQGMFSVFVVSDSNTVNKVEVTPGYKTGNMQVIEKGLKAGDKVVIDALQKVRSGMEIKPVAAKFEAIYQTAKN